MKPSFLDGGNHEGSSRNAGVAVLLLLCALASTCSVGLAAAAAPSSTPGAFMAMFAFGDSYCDTGNHAKGDTTWKLPYGSTWPGSPTGRFGNGKILTDFAAEILNVSSPLPYRQRHDSSVNVSSSGMNFAYGGSGVFYTFGKDYTNLSTQVAQFKQLKVSAGLQDELLHNNSLLLLCYAGNDYIKYAGDHGATLDILSFVPRVVAEIVSNVQSLYELGFRRFLLTGIEPVGCLPSFTRSNNYTACNETANVVGTIHNENLAQMLNASQLQKLMPEAQLTILDQFSSFNAVLVNATAYGISEVFEPCCLGHGNHTCGNEDKEGRPLYTLCTNPNASFFWDNSHPTQAGWSLVAQQYRLQLSALQNATAIAAANSSSSNNDNKSGTVLATTCTALLPVAFWVASAVLLWV